MPQAGFIDNRNGNTLARALATLLDVSGETSEADGEGCTTEVRIATAYFSPTGFAKIAGQLAKIPRVRLLLGADMNLGAPVDRKRLGETHARFHKRRIDTRLRSLEEGLERDRDGLQFTQVNGAALRQLIDSLRAGNLEVRRYERGFLHAKAYIVSVDGNAPAKDGQRGIIAGSSNLTGAGLAENLELNLSRFEDSLVKTACNWYDELWDDAEPYDLAQVFEEVFHPRMPWDIFVRILWQFYGDEVNDEEKTDKNLPLTNFQKHGVARALRLIRDTGGAIVADEVGLGKTFIAGEILKLYIDRRQQALLICPASLRDSTWKRFLSNFQLYVECLSFEQLANEIQLMDKQRPCANKQHLKRDKREYQLVIVDEAHNYRNPDTPTRAAALRTLLYGNKRDLLLLTATPVNNSLWDLYHLLRFFLRQDSHLADRGIVSIKARFDEAMQKDPLSLSPDVLYPIVDATTVKRTRQFVKKHYAGDTITGPDGRPCEIVFPKPRAISVRYELDGRLPGFFAELEEALDPESDAALSFDRYNPDKYRLVPPDPSESARLNAQNGLLRSGLLKRFESSTFAFHQTLDRMAMQHQIFLKALSEGKVVTTKFMREIAGDDDSAFEKLLENTDHSMEAAQYDTVRLKAAVERDLQRLQSLREQAGAISADRDPKLRALADELANIAKQAHDEATSEVDESQKRKVLIFTLFTDTAQWIMDYLSQKIPTRQDLIGYRHRLVVVSGSGDLSSVSREDAVLGFAPVSMEAPSARDDDLYDLMITTDVLAEGVNLQQCRNIINFDMPWNPMRLVQRHGRIDRIGSPHNQVFLRTIFPADRLDDLLNLESRILNKLAMAAASVGVDAPIQGAAQGTQVFTETREEIEKLLSEDASLFERGGTPSAAQSGEEYRQTLRKALSQARNQIQKLPWKVGSGMRKGERRGILFCAVIGSGGDRERSYLRFVPADSAWRPVTDDGAIESELGACMRLLECEEDTTTWCPNHLQEAAYDFWTVARDHILNDWTRETDPANLQPKIRPLNHRVAEFIRKHRPVGTSDDEVWRALEIVESPWTLREESQLREWFDDALEDPSVGIGSLIKEILGTGLEPLKPPDPLPPIDADEIELVCWMGIECAE
ncbi:MAG: helicase-related protein [Bryobacterales bacterium]|nr:helicase-related protein [Bryobacterales bacterium]